MPTVNTCPKCGAMNVGDFANCLRCQAPLPAPQAAPPPQVPTQQPTQAPRAAAPQPPPAPAPAPAAAAAPQAPGLTCPYCRAAVPPGNSFCSACGRQVAGAPAAQPPPPPAAYAPSPAAYAPPPAAYAPAQPAYGYPQQFANNSGTGGGPIPPEIPGWNWGAFFWSWIWGVANGVWVSLLIAMLGIIGSIWLGLKGSEMAWQKRHFASVEQFKGTQRAWGTWGWILFALNLITCTIIALVFGAAIMAAIASGELDPSDFDF